MCHVTPSVLTSAVNTRRWMVVQVVCNVVSSLRNVPAALACLPRERKPPCCWPLPACCGKRLVSSYCNRVQREMFPLEIAPVHYRQSNSCLCRTYGTLHQAEVQWRCAVYGSSHSVLYTLGLHFKRYGFALHFKRYGLHERTVRGDILNVDIT